VAKRIFRIPEYLKSICQSLFQAILSSCKDSYASLQLDFPGLALRKADFPIHVHAADTYLSLNAISLHLIPSEEISFGCANYFFEV